MQIKHKFNKNILRAYDIRGIVGENLKEKDAFMLGYFYCLYLKEKMGDNTVPKIIVSRDGRVSSPSLEKNLIDGLVKAGASVISIGIQVGFSNSFLTESTKNEFTHSDFIVFCHGDCLIFKHGFFFPYKFGL